MEEGENRCLGTDREVCEGDSDGGAAQLWISVRKEEEDEGLRDILGITNSI